MDVGEVIEGAPSSIKISNYDDGSSSIEIDDYEEISSHSNFVNTSHAHEEISKWIEAANKETSNFIKVGDEPKDDEEGDGDGKEKEDEDGDWSWRKRRLRKILDPNWQEIQH